MNTEAQSLIPVASTADLFAEVVADTRAQAERDFGAEFDQAAGENAHG